jgi:hypothetical protein
MAFATLRLLAIEPIRLLNSVVQGVFHGGKEPLTPDQFVLTFASGGRLVPRRTSAVIADRTDQVIGYLVSQLNRGLGGSVRPTMRGKVRILERNQSARTNQNTA